MADIKVDKMEFLYFINSTKEYVDKAQEFLPVSLQEKGCQLLSAIQEYHELRALMEERKIYYDTYMKNKECNPEFANHAYREYKRVQSELEKKRGKKYGNS